MPNTYRSSGMPGDNTQKPTADELLSKLYSKNIPEPTFDQDKADRLQRMGRLNQVGRSLNVLGDIFGTAIGANTRRRQPDTTAPALYQSYQANLDKYKAEKDANLLRDYDKERQDILHQISRADRQEGIDIAQKRFDAQQRMQAAKNNLEWQKYLAGLTQKEKELEERQRNNKAKEGISGAKLKIDQEKANKEDNPEKPWVSVGDYDFNEGQGRKLYDDAVKYYGENSNYIKGLKASFDNQPLETVKHVIARYLLDTKAQSDRQRNAIGVKTTTVEEDVANSKFTNKPDKQQPIPQTTTLPGLKPKNTGYKLPGLGK